MQRFEADERIPFGKHVGQKWSDMALNQRNYLNWLMKNLDETPKNQLLKAKIRLLMESTKKPFGEREISFGKHKGRKWQEVASEDPGYCQWILKKWKNENKQNSDVEQLEALIDVEM
jgi:uncharacterized protein (DUF3820 family)